MKQCYCVFWILVLIISCKLQPDSDRSYDKYDETKVYKLQLSPAPGSVYTYEMINESETEMEVEGEEISNTNKSEVRLNYAVATDSTGNYVFTTTYDKIRLNTENGDTKTEADADNAMVTIDPVEKMLGILKSARIVATITPKGEMKNVSGYKELEDKLMAGFSATDDHSKSMLKAQWEKVIEEGVVKNTMDQFLKIFPDSAIHIGDTWKLNSTQGGELPMQIKNTYILKAINNDIAVISSEGIMTSNQVSNSVVGYTSVSANLKGEQKGEFEIETKTGMLINCRVAAKIKGTLQIMGKDIPISITNTIKVDGRKGGGVEPNNKNR